MEIDYASSISRHAERVYRNTKGSEVDVIAVIGAVTVRAVRRALPRSRLCFQSWMVVLSGVVSAFLNRRAGRRAVGRPGGEMADVSLDAQGGGQRIVAY